MVAGAAILKAVRVLRSELVGKDDIASFSRSCETGDIIGSNGTAVDKTEVGVPVSAGATS